MRNDSKNTPTSWDKVWHSYDRKRYEYQLALEEHRVRWQRIQQAVLEKYGSFSGLNCIEIGAGSGHYSMLFARRGARVTILDYSKNALKICRQMFEELGISTTRVNFLLADALEIENNLFEKFDVSMSFGVAEHSQGIDRKLIVKNHIRVLKKGGMAFISVPNKACITLRSYLFLRKFFRRNMIEVYPFTRKEFANIVNECNLEKLFFVGSSVFEAFSPLAFYRRRKRVIKGNLALKKEKGTFLDEYMGRTLILVAMK